MNYSNLDGENISHATCWTDEFETINKPKPSCRFHRWCPWCRFYRWCPWCRFHRWYKTCFSLEGFRIKASSKSIVNQSQQCMNVDGNGSVANTFMQKMDFFLSGKVKMTIREAGQSLKSTTLTSHITWQVLVLALLYLHQHMIWIIEHGCTEVKVCGQNTSQIGVVIIMD